MARTLLQAICILVVVCLAIIQCEGKQDKGRSPTATRGSHLSVVGHAMTRHHGRHRRIALAAKSAPPPPTADPNTDGRAPLRYSRKEVIAMFNKAAHLTRLAAEEFAPGTTHFTRLYTAMQSFRNAVQLVEMGKKKYSLAEPQMMNAMQVLQMELQALSPEKLARPQYAAESGATRYLRSALRVAQNGFYSFEVQKSMGKKQQTPSPVPPSPKVAQRGPKTAPKPKTVP